MARLDHQLFEAAFSVSHIGIAIETLEGQPLFVNGALCSMLGFSEEELLNKHCSDFSPTEDTERNWALLQQLRAGSIDHYSLDKRYFRKDRSLVWGRLTISLLKDRASPLAVAMIEDITERKKMEEALRRNEHYLAEAEKLAHSGSWAWDVRTRDAFWSQEMFRILGYDPENTKASLSHFWARVHPEDRVRMEQVVQRETSGLDSDVVSDYRIVLPNGAIKYLHAIAHPVKNASGEVIEVAGTTMDVTERRFAEDALRESEERFRMAAQAGRMFNYEWDPATDVIVRSDGVAQVLGEDEGKVTTGQSILAMTPQEDRERLSAAIARLCPEQPYLRISYRMTRSDGTVIWVERNSRAHFDEQGKVLRLVGMIADITERKRAEEALSMMSQKLILAQEEERTRIARELHDDINQQLSLLAVNLETLKQSLPASLKDLGEAIEEMSERAENIGDDVQALSHRLRSSKLEHLGLTAAAASFCKELSDRSKVKIDFQSENVPRELPEATSLCLFRVLQEALQNAIKHSSSKHFQVSLDGGPTEIQLEVRDSGKGFDPEEALQGRGIGLMSMKERLKLVNGTISINSQPQRGTTIRALIPLNARVKSKTSSA